MADARRRALVAGGGIGGMAAATALAQAGWSVVIFERSLEQREVGAGLQMSPNASRCLSSLGILDRVASEAFRPGSAVLRDGRTGALVFEARLGMIAEQRWGAPYLHVHRADLLARLTEAAREAGAELHMGTYVTGWREEEQGGVVAEADVQVGSDGAPSQCEWSADLLVIADGIRSTLREPVTGVAEPRFAGQVAWRALITASALPKDLIPPDATVWAGPGRHLVTYYLRGGSLLNVVGVIETPEWTAEGWFEEGNPAVLREAFAGWHPDLERVLDHVESALKWGLFLRPNPVAWTRGPAVLLGDACHPMLPFMAQGAAMALEDAVTLVRHLDGSGDIASALTAYKSERRPRTEAVQSISRENGELYHRSDGIIRSIADMGISFISQTMPWLAASRLDWVYGFDAVSGRG